MGILSGNHSGYKNELIECIDHAKTNKLAFQNLSKRLTYYGMELEQPVSIFSKYLDLLRDNSMEVPVNPDFFYRPGHFAFYLYGCTEMGDILMLMNGITNAMTFSKEKILVLRSNKIDLLNQIIENHKEELEASRVNPININEMVIKPVIL